MARILELREIKKGESYILETEDREERLKMVKVGSIDPFRKTKSEPAHDCYDLISADACTYRRGYNYSYTWWLWNDIPSEVERISCPKISPRIL